MIHFIHPSGGKSGTRQAFIALATLVLSSAAFAADTTQYIVFNRAPGQGMYQGQPESLRRKAFDEVLTQFPNVPNKRLQTAVSHIFSVFRTPPETTVKALRVFLEAAEQTSTPIVVQIDTEHWWDARPDLWNWWDAAQPGYDPANRENVEWTGWSPENAIKIAWRDWGKQVRVLPQPNLASPRYVEACKAELRRLLPIVLDWHGSLPAEKKHLLIGIKLGHETSIGGSAYYFEGGNDLLGKPAADDPVLPFDAENVLTRGRAQIGYAAVKTSGIRSSGGITESDLRDVCQRYLATLCREAAQIGVPRDKLFAHGIGWKDGELLYDAPVNPDSCPGWSFYKHAADPHLDSGVQRNLARSDAPHWAACEYWLPSGDASAWRDALTKTLSDPRCRYVCLFNWESMAAFPGIEKGIREFINDAGNFANAYEAAAQMSTAITNRGAKQPAFHLFRIVWTTPSNIAATLDRLKKLRSELDIELLDLLTFFVAFERHQERFTPSKLTANEPSPTPLVQSNGIHEVVADGK